MTAAPADAWTPDLSIDESEQSVLAHDGSGDVLYRRDALDMLRAKLRAELETRTRLEEREAERRRTRSTIAVAAGLVGVLVWTAAISAVVFGVDVAGAWRWVAVTLIR